MPIQVTCPGCLTRFSVPEKFAGKEGPCPKCKETIQIPSLDEQVVIHAPTHSEAGAIGRDGKNVLKTTRKKDTKFDMVVFGGVALAVLVVVAAAFVMRDTANPPGSMWLAIGAVLLGPPLAWAGYTFLRDDELEAYGGVELTLRSLGCGLAYAAGWGVYIYVGEYLFDDADFSTSLVLETFQMGILSAIMIGIGTFAAFVAFDLEPTTGFFGVVLFLVVTVILRIIVGWPALPGLAAGAG